jgi:hypothetical protein
MDEGSLRISLTITAFMIASGVFDSLAFTFAARMWQGGSIVWDAAAKSAVSFLLGIGMYWGAVRHLSRIGVVMPEMQTLLWFFVTIVGVALIGGRFFEWRLAEQLVALNVLLSMGWLLSRTAAA